MHSANLQEIIFLLLAAVFIVAAFRRLQLSPVLGYLVAGGAIGPFGMKIIENVETTKFIAEFGVVFLLFSIGLELTLSRLKAMRLHVFGFGSLQLIITGTLISSACYYWGIGAAASIVIGGGFALSSTAIVLQVLAEKGEQSTQVGRLSLAVLILQDLAVVPLLIMVPLLGDASEDILVVVFDSLVKAALALVLIFLIGRQFLKPLFGAIASLKSQELFIATTLLIVLGSAFITNELGLSLALGAFMAGLLVAETEFRPQVESDIEPFKGLLMGLFFMTIGMSIDFRIFADKLYLILLLTTSIMVGKAVIIMVLARMFKFRLQHSINAGVILSQGSEFAFVLFGLAAMTGVFEQELSQLLLVIISITMAITPLAFSISKKITGKFNTKNPVHLNSSDMSTETADLDNHIIVAGFGRVGKAICKLLSAKDINYIVIDSNPSKVHKGRKEGFPVFFGNADKVSILNSLGIKRAKLLAITINDTAASKKIVIAIHKAFPDMPIIARAKDKAIADELEEIGVTLALSELFESSLILGSSILKISGTPDAEIEILIEQFRQEEYG